MFELCILSACHKSYAKILTLSFYAWVKICSDGIKLFADYQVKVFDRDSIGTCVCRPYYYIGSSNFC